MNSTWVLLLLLILSLGCIGEEGKAPPDTENLDESGMTWQDHMDAADFEAANPAFDKITNMLMEENYDGAIAYMISIRENTKKALEHVEAAIPRSESEEQRNDTELIVKSLKANIEGETLMIEALRLYEEGEIEEGDSKMDEAIEIVWGSVAGLEKLSKSEEYTVDEEFLSAMGPALDHIGRAETLFEQRIDIMEAGLPEAAFIEAATELTKESTKEIKAAWNLIVDAKYTTQDDVYKDFAQNLLKITEAYRYSNERYMEFLNATDQETWEKALDESIESYNGANKYIADTGKQIALRPELASLYKNP